MSVVVHCTGELGAAAAKKQFLLTSQVKTVLLHHVPHRTRVDAAVALYGRVLDLQNFLRDALEPSLDAGQLAEVASPISESEDKRST